jgi:hypothetical protein
LTVVHLFAFGVPPGVLARVELPMAYPSVPQEYRDFSGTGLSCLAWVDLDLRVVGSAVQTLAPAVQAVSPSWNRVQHLAERSRGLGEAPSDLAARSAVQRDSTLLDEQV